MKLNVWKIPGGKKAVHVKMDWFCAPCLSSIFPFNHFDNDEEFLLALHESNSEFTFNIDPFKDLIFNPISETLTNINKGRTI